MARQQTMMWDEMRMVRRGLLILLLALCFMNMASVVTEAVDDISQVQQEIDKGQNNSPKQNNLWWEFIKLVFFLLLLVGAAGSVIRFLGKNTTARSQGLFVHIVDEVVLGPNRGIALCEVGGKLYGLGITEHHITLLFETDNPRLLEEISQESLPVNQTRSGPLSKILGQAISAGGGRTGNANGQFSILMAEQVRRLQDMISKNGEKGSGVKKSDHYE